MEFNERKLQVLEVVQDQKIVDSESLSYLLDLTIIQSRVYLLRYHRSGLLNRRKIDNGTGGYYVYRLSSKGSNKIDYLQHYM